MTMSFQLNLSPKDRAAAKFIGRVRMSLLKALVHEKKKSGITQQAVASKMGVNRSVVNRLIKGEANLTLRSLAEIAWAIGWEPHVEIVPQQAAPRNVLIHRVGGTISSERLVIGQVNGARTASGANESATNDNYAPVCHEVAA
jgi:predicted XRE-type DNA-binding protein